MYSGIMFMFYCLWVSEWLLVNVNTAILQLYHKLICNEMMMSASSLIQQPDDRRRNYLDSDPTSLCSFSFVVCAQRGARNTNIIVFALTRSGLDPTFYCTRVWIGKSLQWYELEVVRVDDGTSLHGTSWQWYELTSYRQMHGDVISWHGSWPGALKTVRLKL